MAELIGVVKGPGELPNEYVFITKDKEHTKVGEYVYYNAPINGTSKSIVGRVKSRSLAVNLPPFVFSEPNLDPFEVLSALGIERDSAEFYEIVVENVGYFDSEMNGFVNPRIPPIPGDKIYLTPSEMLSEMISPKRLGEIGGAHIGSLLMRKEGEVPVVLSVKEMVSTHLAILASTGAGKSYTAAVLIEELMRPYNRAAVLVIDPHSEYHTLSKIQELSDFKEKDYSPKVKIYPSKEIKVRFSNLTEADIKYLLPEGATEKMYHFLSTAFRSLTEKLRTEGRKDYSWQDLYDEIDELSKDSANQQHQSTFEGLKWRISARFNKKDGVFSNTEHITLKDIFEPGKCTVFQLSDIEENEQQVIVATILRRVFKARKKTVRGESKPGEEDYLPYPVFVILEEGHRFAPAKANAVSTSILKEILGEGRKFGVGIGLISQSPRKLDQDVLSQCMTQIIMRIINPNDQKTIYDSVQEIGRSILDELPALTKGQAVISGLGINSPVLCRIRNRMTEHGGETLDAPNEWQKYFSASFKQKIEQVNAPYIRHDSEKEEEKFGGFKV
ncbi:MAG: ATP-binding protein [Acidobacteria bacterium]|nr:MAG: ATP-binding protein [Acidobacteriota bacterium]